MSFLDFPGLQYFYNKYLKPIKPHAREETIKSYTVNEQGHVPDAQLVAQLKEENESLQAKVEALNSALSHLQCTGVASISGETSITVDAGMSVDNLYLIFIRQLNGSTDVHPPCALLLYMRTDNYRYSTLGEIVDLQNTTIEDRKFTIDFKTQQWVRVWVFKIS